MRLFGGMALGADKNRRSARKAQVQKLAARWKPVATADFGNRGFAVELAKQFDYFRSSMTAATSSEKQIECYRNMTGEQRLAIA